MGVYQVAEGIRVYYDDGVARQLQKKKELVTKKDRDYFFIVDGDEGCGKSFLAFQLAKFLDPTFDLDRIAFNGNQFLEVIKKATKGQAIVFDEAFTGLSARASMSEMNKLLVETIMEVRKKNLFVFVVLPSVFFLERYVVLSRARVLFHCYFKKERRGWYGVYDKKQIKWLMLAGRKTMSYNVTRPRMNGKFSGRFALDVEGSDEKKNKYEQMKLDAITSKGTNKRAEKQKEQRDVCLTLLHLMGLKFMYLEDILDEMGVGLGNDIVGRAVAKWMPHKTKMKKFLLEKGLSVDENA